MVTPTVGRVAEGVEQHRHVVVLVGVGDREHHDHLGVEAVDARASAK